MDTLLNFTPVFTRKDENTFVMEIDERYFNVNQEVKTVLEIVSKSSAYTDAANIYNGVTGESNSVEDFKFYAEEIIKKFGLEEKTESFLLIEKIILKPKTAGKIAGVLEFLFQPVFFWFSLILLIVFSLYSFFLVAAPQITNLSSVSIFTSVILYFITIIFHEFGHLAACRRFTGKNGGLGLGIYLVYPVFFSNISAIWQASKAQKVIANLAGIYMQLWFVLIFFIVYLFTLNPFFLDFSKALSFICFIQILPFIRSDGYWLLNDIFGVDNLMEKSNAQVKKFFTGPISFVRKNKAANYGLFFYGVFNIFFVASFAYYQLRYNLTMLLNFPEYLWHLLLKVFAGRWSEITFDFAYLSVILFYFIIYNYLKMLFTRVSGKDLKRF